MNLNEKLSILEAVLFACGEPMESNKLAEVCKVTVDIIADLIKFLMIDMIQIKALAGYETWWILPTLLEKEFAGYIKTILESKRSTRFLIFIEALTIVAYNQPVTKSFVENIRGVDSSSIVNSLVEKELLMESGRLDVPGKPVLFKTTNTFLRCFGLNSLDDLPPLHDDYEDKPLFKGNNVLLKDSE